MLPGFERAALDILHHHESFDGKGYPRGSRTRKYCSFPIVCVIDAFDAMVPPARIARVAYEEAVRRLSEASGTQFDPVVVRTFLTFARSEMSIVLPPPARRFPQPCRTLTQPLWRRGRNQVFTLMDFPWFSPYFLPLFSPY